MKLFFTLLISGITLTSTAQEVAKTIIVEHYTNTYCSACASRNPGFYTNLNNHPEVLHIAYHPSSPYSACPLSQHNVSENDARTNFYNIYGGTPRLVVQGNVIPPGDDYSSSVLFDPYENQTTPFQLSTSIAQNTSLDSVVVSVTITKTAASVLDSLDLYTAIVEETLNFDASNGENVHHDVFRKSAAGEQPIRIELPEIIGEDTVITFRAIIDDEWNGNELKAISILQDDQKQVEQANESALISYTASLTKQSLENIELYPNPTTGKVFVKTNSEMIEHVIIYSITGQEIINKVVASGQTTIDLSNENQGVYICRVYTSKGIVTKRLIRK
ncbi:MAG: hypothetical protein COA32_09635 [Fluviicola sp.]|nr:MAG: hypothetical protein COA32_09635 [Fluviicola sp.]